VDTPAVQRMPVSLLMSARILAAAIRVNATGIVFSVPAPGRHHDVIRVMVHEHGIAPPIDHGRYEQGFTLDDGTFVRRKPAKHIARAAGQLLPRASDHAELFSEDVW
jgi:hypothetical protein